MRISFYSDTNIHTRFKRRCEKNRIRSQDWKCSEESTWTAVNALFGLQNNRFGDSHDGRSIAYIQTLCSMLEEKNVFGLYIHSSCCSHFDALCIRYQIDIAINFCYESQQQRVLWLHKTFMCTIFSCFFNECIFFVGSDLFCYICIDRSNRKTYTHLAKQMK